MKKHIKEVHDKENSFRCDVCGAIFSGKHNLNQHVTKDLGEKKLHVRNRVKSVPEEKNCNIASKKNSAKNSLTLHIDSDHDETKSLECDLCNVSFLTKRGLKQHILWYCKETNKN